MREVRDAGRFAPVRANSSMVLGEYDRKSARCERALTAISDQNIELGGRSSHAPGTTGNVISIVISTARGTL